MSKNSTVYECTIIELDKHHRDECNITVVENVKTVPFEVKRTYYLYDIPGGEARGGHAHKELFQLVIAASGSFNVTVDDGSVKRTFSLNRPYQGLYIVPGMWRELVTFHLEQCVWYLLQCLMMKLIIYEYIRISWSIRIQNEKAGIDNWW